MSILQLLLLAPGVSADAFAVALVQGTTIREHVSRRLLHMAVIFGGFQALMPLIGWALGSSVAGLITEFDHWIAFVLLGGIGLMMAMDAVKPDDDEDEKSAWGGRTVLALGVATSIDALAVGIGFAMVPINIVLAIALIGVTTFLATLAGGWLGQHGGRKLGRPATMVGGLILIAIGVNILIDHLGG
ncbi:MAG TPA: manganese efflux pump MntP family protein [Candidatus Corynebacterium avicola]|uniref:Putative manganese efflux pump MntP n=1 Tax=Candidatus Corynebacterium avicola TaxID=2838527 RepID=A0A9D1RNY8_9CORY|nr:manganese efflux pump MntP family protein [Candidatus Corynebacterium avicola]